MAEGDGNGWRDPYLRKVRTVAFVILASLLVWVIVVEPGPNDLATTGTIGGMLLVLLGYEALTRWPPR